MNFDRTNDPRRLYLLQTNLYGDYTAGNGIRTNSLGHRLVDGSIAGLTDLVAPHAGVPEEIFMEYFLGLVFLET